MKLIKKALFVICLLPLFLTACSKQSEIRDSAGNLIQLSDYRGKWMLINYWAVWCEPCMKEMPILNKLQKDYKNKVVILGVNFDQSPSADIQAVAKRYALTYPLLSQFPIAQLSTEEVSVVPTTFVINPQGQLFQILKGPQSETQLMKALHLS
jgi:thiol-disulfide isomerase/thioredoxin